jgi:hypothetical protein
MKENIKSVIIGLFRQGNSLNVISEQTGVSVEDVEETINIYFLKKDSNERLN